MPAVQVDQLVVRHGDVVAVDGLGMAAEAGEVTVVLGPNGAGKTSTLEVLEGFRSPDGGSVRVLGLDPIADHGALVARVGVVLQQGGVYPGIRAGEAVRLFASYFADPLEPAALLERVGLAGKAGRTWKQLSGGEQQRLSLALAIVGRPEVAFLDEPTAGVDLDGRQLVRQVVRDLADDGVAVVLTTHELDEAERVADRVVIVDHGAVVAQGPLAEVLASGAGPEVRFSAVAGLDVTALSAALAAHVTEVSPGAYVVDAEGTPALVAALTGWLASHDLALGDLRAGRHRLEDVVLRLTRGER